MKKIAIIICFLVGVLGYAQAPVVTGNPSNYTVIDENVEVVFDVTNATDNGGNSLVGKDLYIWAFSSAGDAKTNGSWTNIKPSAQLNKISDTQYSIQFPIIDGANTYNTIAEWFGAEAAPGSITSIGYLLRDQSPSFQTDDLSIPFSPFKFDEAEVRTFPSSATTQDVLMFRFNKSITPLSNPALTGAQNISVHIEPANDASLAVDVDTSFSGRYYEAGIIPSSTFSALAAANNLQILNYYFFDKDNPTIQSKVGSITLKKASN